MSLRRVSSQCGSSSGLSFKIMKARMLLKFESHCTGADPEKKEGGG